MLLKQNIRTITYSAISALLSFIIVFNLSFNAFHTQTEVHHHAEQSCTADEEFDACHRFLIHHEKSSECNGQHKHFSEKTEDCFICTFFKNQHEIIQSKKHLCPLVRTSSLESLIKLSFFKSPYLSFAFLRGPPTLG